MKKNISLISIPIVLLGLAILTSEPLSQNLFLLSVLSFLLLVGYFLAKVFKIDWNSF